MTTERVGPSTIVTTTDEPKTTPTATSQRKPPAPKTTTTAKAVTTQPASSIGGIEAVSPGMKVFDSTGEEIGEVTDVKHGDPDAVTTEGATMNPDRGGLIQDVAEAFAGGGEPRLPGSLYDQYLRLGFIRIDTKGLFTQDRYASSRLIGTVTHDRVQLNVTKDELPEAQ